MIWGAIFGDIIGSYYEVHCTKNYGFEFHRESAFTDDTVLTAAVCKAIVLDSRPVSYFRLNVRALEFAAQYKQLYSKLEHTAKDYIDYRLIIEKSAHPL